MKNTLIAFFLFSITLHLSAQSPDTLVSGYFDYEKPRDFTIVDITISGVKFLQTTYLVNISGLAIGDQISIPGEKITAAIDKFWSLGLFSDVKISATKIEGRSISLDIHLTERPRLSRVTVHGLNKNDTKDVTEKIKLKPGNQITENVLNNTETIIKKHFLDKGFFNCKVDMVQKSDTTPGNKVFLDITVDKGKKVKIQDINFIGNNAFKDAQLRKTLKKTKQKSLNFFKPSKYIDAQYKEDKKYLIDFYNEKGYRDARIASARLVPIDKKRIGLEVTVEEGMKYYVRSIVWVGNTKYSSAALNRVLNMKKGDVYDQSHIEKRLSTDDDAVTSQYMDEGYLFFGVDPVEANIDGDSIDLEMRISEGNQATINRIIIKGNTKTNEHVIRREIRTIPGDLFSKTNIVRSVRELAAMGHFNPENIAPNPIPNMADGTVDIEYSLEERSNDQLEVSGGWGGYGFVGTIGLRFSNFSARKLLDLKAWRPIPTGDGQTLSVRAQSNGRYYQAYNLSFVEPWFGGKKPNSFSTSFYYTITKSFTNSAISSGLSQDAYFKVLGASIGLGRRLSWPDDYFVLYTAVGLQKYFLNQWGSNFIINDGVSNIIDFNISLSRSSQDQMIYPRRGSAFSLSLKLTPPWSLFKPDGFYKLSDAEEMAIRDDMANTYPGLSENQLDAYTATEVENQENSNKYEFIEYHKWSFNSAWYTSIIGNLVLSARSEFGYLGYYNADIGTSPFEKFNVGGSGMMGYNLYGTDIVALRGYADGTLTPQTTVKRNGANVRIDDGNVYIKYTLEMRYPFSLNPSATIFGLAFLEGGNCWQKIDQFNPFMIKRSAGIGLRAFLPMFGMLGIDWGYGFDLPNASDTPPDEIRRGHHGSEFHFTMGQQF
jgi:outer membrane protein insertion porin family